MEGASQATMLQHLGESRPSGSPVTPPIVQTSLFVFDSCEELWEAQSESFGPPFAYSRISNPTNDIAEQKISALEGTERSKLYGSGMGAISSAILSCVERGSHIVALDTCYGPTKQFIADYLPKFGIRSTFVDGQTAESFLDAVQPETTCVYLESPGSIVFRLLEVERICRECRARGITTIFDNSYATPIYQRPASLGADIVVHSATKYIAGHSDLCAGALCTSAERMKAIVDRETALFGSALGPFPAWLLLRGLRTLHLRMAWAQTSGNAIADFLESRAEVAEVFHVGRGSERDRTLFAANMTGSSSLLSFVPNFQDMEKVKRFVEALELFQIGVSWGGFESLSVPIYMQPMDWPEPRWVIRLYCGLEDPKDLASDLARAFEAIG